MNTYYTYVHKRASTGEPFYYGKGKGSRAWVKTRNPWHTNVRNKHGIVVEILSSGLTDEEAKAEEMRLIAEAIERGENITNQTPGGDGLSVEMCRKNGAKVRDLKLGVFSLSKDQLSENGKLGGAITGRLCKDKGIGVCGIPREKSIEIGKRIMTEKLGIFAMTEDQKIEACRKGGNITGKISFENKTGVHSRTKEQMSEDGRKGGNIHLANKTGLFSPGAQAKGGKKPHWYNPITGERKRDYTCPSDGFIPGRGPLPRKTIKEK